MQELIPINVIDSTKALTQMQGVLTADEIRDELIRQLESGAVTGRRVAAHLSIAPARVTEMKNRTRRVQQNEMRPLAQLLGLSDTSAKTTQVREVFAVPNLGKVAQGVWIEEAHTDPDQMLHVAYDRLAGDTAPIDLFAVTPEGNSMNKAFMPGTQLICRRVGPGSDEWALNGDYVIVQRVAHDMRELTCKRVERADSGVFYLHSESDDPAFAEPWVIGRPEDGEGSDIEIQIIGKVIRAVQDFERPRK